MNDILDSYIALKQRIEEKAQKKRELLAALDAEYEGLDEQYEQERKTLFDWMNENKFIEFNTNLGKVVVRPSRPKYIVRDEDKLVQFLSDNSVYAGLTFKKGIVNELCQQGRIPEDIVGQEIVDELVIYIEGNDAE